MSERGHVWAALVTFVVCFPLLLIVANAMTSPTYQAGFTARYEAYQSGRTQRELAEQATRQTQAQERGATLRTWGQWGGGVLAVAVVAGVAGYTIIQWQRERTRRHGMTEQRRVIVAYIGMYGGREGRWLGGQGLPRGALGVYLEDGEFVPWNVAAAELPAAALLTVDA
jgi:hypothetical protein